MIFMNDFIMRSKNCAAGPGFLATKIVRSSLDMAFQVSTSNPARTATKGLVKSEGFIVMKRAGVDNFLIIALISFLLHNLYPVLPLISFATIFNRLRSFRAR